MQHIKKFESLFDDIPATLADAYYEMTSDEFKQIIIDEYSKNYNNSNNSIYILGTNLSEYLKNIYIKKDHKTKTLNIITTIKNYNVILEFIVSSDTVVGNIFDNKTFEQKYQINAEAKTVLDVLSVFENIATILNVI
jgi:hypothetical protein